ncbi:2Fe-2S iron-sulfur cluster-binding protein [Pseudorhodobacter turbinis]|uniref:2Fe-2S iron-sulfur cluster-binding protein n=1 Tax=Pseudorhodobacter turbinis TaxID=2500533 RepID=UPI001980F745|nr:2Fe-2S iron-sulfur cluster-binding protein [Pseudorhodobacter turbinis]
MNESTVMTLSPFWSRGASLSPPRRWWSGWNGTDNIDAARGDKLLGVLHGANIGIPAACGGSDTCGLCRVVVEGAGAGEALATEKGILSAAERKANVRLACQTMLRGPCEVTVPQEFLGDGVYLHGGVQPSACAFDPRAGAGAAQGPAL